MNFEQLLEGPKLRTQTVTIEGFGEVEITRLSGLEMIKLMSDTEALDDSNQVQTQLHLAFWASRMMKGEFATDEEIGKIQENLSADVIAEIYQAGLRDFGSKEEHEKN